MGNRSVSNNDVWKIYVPHTLLSSPEGYVFGFIYPEKCFICITCLEDNYSKSLDSDEQLVCLGFWQGLKKLSKHKRKGNSLWISLSISQGLLNCVLQTSSGEDRSRVTQNAIYVVYNAKDLLSSYILNSNKSKIISTEKYINTSNLNILVNCLLLYRRCTKETYNNTCLISRSSNKNIFYEALTYFTTISCWICFTLGEFWNKRGSVQLCMKYVVQHISFFHQINLKYLQIKQVWNKKSVDVYQDIGRLNIHTRLLVDMFLGVGVMILFMTTNLTDIMASSIIAWADAVVIWLNDLLEWLMGVPAGLKLNSQLDQFLGRFFHYHIYLWTGYLTLLKPILSPLLWYSSIVGVLGVSCQLCLLQDIFATLTVHIYCFYVYAARLYYFQVHGLSSLWRLFRGKKWNVLRRRVDSASYDVDQLFVGTLLFTILLFLLPTTALYYVVFLGLRLLVLTVTGAVSKIVSFINSLPFHGLLLRMCQSSKITGDILLTIHPEQTSNDSLCVYMTTKQVPYSQIWKLLKENSTSRLNKPQYTWQNLLYHVLIGELIYPWVELNNQTGQ